MPEDRIIKGGMIGSRKKPREQRDSIQEDDFLASLGTSIAVPAQKEEQSYDIDHSTGEVIQEPEPIPIIQAVDDVELTTRRRRKKKIPFHEMYKQFSTYIDKRLIDAWEALLEESGEESKTELFNEAISLLLLKYQNMLREECHIDVHKLPLYPLPRKRRY